MPTDYLHNHKQFPDLIRIVAEQKGIDPALVEKDYWIMHSLYGLQKLGLTFELKDGILLEAGFDVVAPNTAKDISSWMYDHAADKVEIIDNRAKGIACYDPGYTFVEKLQTISTKYRQQQKDKQFPPNFMRHYYEASRVKRFFARFPLS